MAAKPTDAHQDDGRPAIAVRHLAVRYRDVQAIDDVSFTLPPRGVNGLLGPNGAGKSSLLRVLATIQEPDGGEFEILGTSVSGRRSRREARARLGYMPQDPGYYPHFRVRQFATHIALLKQIPSAEERRHEVERVLELVDLGAKSRARIKTLSGGMRQRLALACALLGDPPVLVLDEPTVGLDPEQRIRFREMIADLGASRAVLLSTHQTDDIAELCHRVLVLVEGRLRFVGSATDLKARAAGRVWLADGPADGAVAGWVTASGRWRGIGLPPADGELVEPTIDDGYLIVAGSPGGGRQ